MSTSLVLYILLIIFLQQSVCYICKMGKSYSKQEEVIINQQGANHAGYTSWERNMNSMGILTIIITVMVAAIIIVWIFISCRSKVKKWVKKEMTNSVIENRNVQV